jgi:hypothetical protein
MVAGPSSSDVAFGEVDILFFPLRRIALRVVASDVGVAYPLIGSANRSIPLRRSNAFENQTSAVECAMDTPQEIRGTKISANELVNLLNKWQRSGLKVQLAITTPEITTILGVEVTKVDFPTASVALSDNSWANIDLHFSGALLERFEGDEGVGTIVRASWNSDEARQITLAEMI